MKKEINFFTPHFALTKSATIRFFERNLFPVINVNDTLYFDVSSEEFQYLEFSAVNNKGLKPNYNYTKELLEIGGDFMLTFDGIEEDRGAMIFVKTFHRRLFFEIITTGVGVDDYKGYFYILKCENFYKIGITQNPEKRFLTHKIDNPFKIEVVFCEKIYCANLVEQEIKKWFKHQNERGEWFSFSKRDLLFLRGSLTLITNFQ